jgi:hypothetical protein
VADLSKTSIRSRGEVLREWVHSMHLEFLRVPIMVPVWWAGMKLCDLLWGLK